MILIGFTFSEVGFWEKQGVIVMDIEVVGV